MGHELQDAISLELARRVAAGLPQHPEWLDVARANIERWSHRNSNAPALLQAYHEWQELLSMSLEEIVNLLVAETDEGQRLRQSSPFAGVLSPDEVWKIKSQFRHATSPA